MRIDLPPLCECDNPFCKDGLVTGIYHTDTCFKCNGAGVLAADSKKAVAAEVLIPAMKQAIQLLKAENAKLRALVPQCDDQVYGELPIRLGGKSRLD